MDDLITMTEAAKRMGCTREWVYYLIKNNRLQARMVGRMYVLRVKDVDAVNVRPRAKPAANGHTSSAPPKKQGGKKPKPSKSGQSRSR